MYSSPRASVLALLKVLFPEYVAAGMINYQFEMFTPNQFRAFYQGQCNALQGINVLDIVTCCVKIINRALS